MRTIPAILAVTAMMAAMVEPCLGAATKHKSAPQASQVLWFSGKEGKGLRQDRHGDLLALGQRLALRPRIRDLYAAAYYPEFAMLVTVDGKAVTRLYERRGTRLELTETHPPREPAKTHRSSKGKEPTSPVLVRFCSIPGLIYLTWSYPEPREMRTLQMSRRHAERVALGARASGWHAAATESPNMVFPEYVYQITPKSVHLAMPDGESVSVQLRDPLAEWAPGQDTHNYWEPVTVIPGRAIICQTTMGWSIHDFRGMLTGAIVIPAGERRGHRLGRWRHVFYHSGRFYAAENIPDLSYYRLDFAQGKMVYVGRELPDQQPQRAR